MRNTTATATTVETASSAEAQPVGLRDRPARTQHGHRVVDDVRDDRGDDAAGAFGDPAEVEAEQGRHGRVHPVEVHDPEAERRHRDRGGRREALSEPRLQEPAEEELLREARTQRHHDQHQRQLRSPRAPDDVGHQLERALVGQAQHRQDRVQHVAEREDAEHHRRQEAPAQPRDARAQSVGEALAGEERTEHRRRGQRDRGAAGRLRRDRPAAGGSPGCARRSRRPRRRHRAPA